MFKEMILDQKAQQLHHLAVTRDETKTSKIGHSRGHAGEGHAGEGHGEEHAHDAGDEKAMGENSLVKELKESSFWFKHFFVFESGVEFLQLCESFYAGLIALLYIKYVVNHHMPYLVPVLILPVLFIFCYLFPRIVAEFAFLHSIVEDNEEVAAQVLDQMDESSNFAISVVQQIRDILSFRTGGDVQQQKKKSY